MKDERGGAGPAGAPRSDPPEVVTRTGCAAPLPAVERPPLSANISRRTLLTAAATGSATLLTAAPATAAPAFADVPPGHPFHHQISWTAERGISTGWGTGAQRTFRPDQHINRDAMAAFLHRLAGSPSATGDATFRDVGPGMMFRQEISWLASTGITTGWADGTFRPLSTVNRDAMAAFLYRMAGSPPHPTPTRAPFRDVPPSLQFSKQISWLASTGISTGWPDDTFRPLQPVERGAMAAFLHRYDALGLRTSIPLVNDVSTFVRDAEAAILAATNSYRADAGARALSRRTEMDGVARTWSTTMATTGRFEHNPRYAEQIPGGWRAAAENIAYRSVGRGTETGRALALQWFNSPGHQANMLRAGFTNIGIGVHVQDGIAYGTQVFAQY